MVVSAVATTGIYCRPQCGARPHARNVSAYPSPVAAEAAGYRSCLRCRPDRHLPTATADRAPAPVVAALALITDGYLDRFDEDSLAMRVGYSTRQLRRLFADYVGASPAFVARSRRAHFARRLLDETDLSIPTIARASGFGSDRQMRRVVEQIFGFSPADLRSRRRPTDVLVADGGLRLRASFVGTIDLDGAVSHLRPRIIDGVEAMNGSTYRRTIEICGNPGVIEVELVDHGGQIAITAHLPTFDSVIDDIARVKTMLGLDDDSRAGVDHLADDPLLAPLVAARPGVRVMGGWDRFETAVRIVIGQQVSVAGAATVTSRLAARHGRRLDGTVLGLTHLFPTPDALADIDDEPLGMPRRRVETLRRLARAVLDGDLDLYGSPGPDRLRGQLMDIDGIGGWTAETIAMRAAHDPDAFPASDLGIRRVLGRRLGRSEPVSETEATKLSERWRPHRALAAQHLWAAAA